MNNCKRDIRIAFTGGGSAGHIIPGLAVYDALGSNPFFNHDQLSASESAVSDGSDLKKQSNTISAIWLASKKQRDAEIISTRDIKVFTVSSGKMRRYFSLKNITDLAKIVVGILQSLYILRKERPKVLFSKGGFVSFAPVVAAGILKIPVLIHDSDYDPGLATRLTARFADKILVPYEESIAQYSESIRGKVRKTGNPVRSDLLSGNADKVVKKYTLNPDLPVLLIVGGSQGAVEINKLLQGCIDELCELFSVFHITGSNWSFEFSHMNYHPMEFAGEIYPDMIAAADIVVSRAGAGVLWELAVSGKKMVLIPKGKEGSRGDQLRNAEFFNKHKAALVLKSKKVDTEMLKNAILGLHEKPEESERIAGNAGALCNSNAAEEIAGLIKTYLR